MAYAVEAMRTTVASRPQAAPASATRVVEREPGKHQAGAGHDRSQNVRHRWPQTGLHEEDARSGLRWSTSSTRSKSSLVTLTSVNRVILVPTRCRRIPSQSPSTAFIAECTMATLAS